jgi:Bacterial extracellular solute-binding protein.
MKKIACILLTVFLSISTFSCNNEKQSDSTAETDNQSISETAAETESRYTPNLPDVTYDGYTYKVFQRGPSASEWPEVCIWADSENGEPLNDAVYKRNLYISEKYDISIQTVDASGGIYLSDILNQFRSSVMSGSNDFDMAMMGVKDSASVASEGLLYNLYLVDYLDLTQPWWEKNVNDSLTMLNRLYFAISYMGINDKDDSFVIMYNKQVAEDVNAPDLYELVKNNEWYSDKFFEIAKTAVKDLNGDSEMGLDDRYGYSGFDAEVWNNFIASGERIVKVDENGYPYIAIDNERADAVYNYIYKLFYSDNVMLNTSVPGAADLHGYTYKLISENRVLFAGAAMTVVAKARAMETDFGILPYPKFDQEQDKYYTICGLWGPTALTIPVTVTNDALDRAAIITEAMVCESMNTIFPAYYDINLVTKGLRDTQSEEMLDIIFKGRVYDIGMLFPWGGISDFMVSNIRSKKENFESGVQKLIKQANKQLDKTMEQFESLSDK